MKILNRYIIKEHIWPFLFAFFVIMFILLMNFLVKYIDEIFGKGLPYITVAKLIIFNLSWMAALAVPMATLVAVLMAFGRFSADNEITILKSSGISVYRIIRPSMYVGIFLTAIMIYFSDQILPESNHQASNMFRSIRQKKPTLQMEEHIFYDLNNFTFIVNEIDKPLPDEWLNLSGMLGPEYRSQDDPDRLKNITIFDRSKTGKDVTIFAREGYMIYSSAKKALIFTLFDGEFHELDHSKMDEYQRSAFRKNMVYIPAEGFDFEEREHDYRSDREMTINMMREKIKEFEEQIRKQKQKVQKKVNDQFAALKNMILLSDSLKADSLIAANIGDSKWQAAQRKAMTQARRNEQQMKTSHSYIENHQKSINRYGVEVHKKLSIPFASIVFVLVGAPLGVMARRGSMGVAISLSIGFFLLYWAFLIGGEDLADRRFLSPAMSMWAPNIIVGIAGMYLTWRAVKESSFINWERLGRIFKFGNRNTKKQRQEANAEIS